MATDREGTGRPGTPDRENRGGQQGTGQRDPSTPTKRPEDERPRGGQQPGQMKQGQEGVEEEEFAEVGGPAGKDRGQTGGAGQQSGNSPPNPRQ